MHAKKGSDELKIKATCKKGNGKKFGDVTFSFELLPKEL